MTRRKAYLIVQTILCVLVAALLAAAAVRVQREGSLRVAEDALENIYTRDAVADAFGPIAPLLFLAIGLSIAGRILDIRSEGIGPRMKAPLFSRGPAAGARGLPEETKREQAAQGRLRLAMLLAALGLIAAGVINQSARDMFYKAITICSECIGLG